MFNLVFFWSCVLGFVNTFKFISQKQLNTYDEGLISILYTDVFDKYFEDYNNAVEDAAELSTKDLYDKLEYFEINKSFATLFFKVLNTLNNPLGDKESLLYAWIGKLYDNIVNIYIDELSSRDIKDKIDILTMLREKIDDNK